jgi:two-component system chemotaxis response regulator CheY
MSKGKARVLICDDERHIRMLLSAIIKDLGGEVVGEASNGEEAIAQYETLRPHLVLLDINMPKLNGDKALERIMHIDPKALVIMLTAQDSADVVRKTLDLGAFNYILKGNPAPVIQQLIKEAWKDYLSEIQGREA